MQQYSFKPIHSISLQLRRYSSTLPDNYYKLLGVAERFPVDEALLSSNYKTLQRQWHPDKFACAASSQQATAATMSARINEAYATLASPDRRAKHLLRLRSHADPPPLDPRFLAWVIEFQEDVAAAEQDPEQLKRLAGLASDKVDICLDSLSHAFEEGVMDAAAREIATLQFLRSIERAIADKRF